MKYLKSKILVCVISCFGCRAIEKKVIMNQYVKVIKENKAKELVVIEVDTSRILHYCWRTPATDENKWRHFHQISVLDDQNRVIPFMSQISRDKVDCNSDLKKIDQIIKKSKTVRICGVGNLEITGPDKGIIYEVLDFGKLGNFKADTYSTLELERVCNEKKCQDTFRFKDTDCDNLY